VSLMGDESGTDAALRRTSVRRISSVRRSVGPLVRPTRSVLVSGDNPVLATVLIIGLDGEVQQELSPPRGGEFTFGEANAYYSERPTKQCPWGTPHLPKFACTDVTYLDGKLYVVTGCADLRAPHSLRARSTAPLCGPISPSALFSADVAGIATGILS
jgi:hypothetical protein